MFDLAIVGGDVYIKGAFVKADLFIRAGRIEGITVRSGAGAPDTSGSCEAAPAEATPAEAMPLEASEWFDATGLKVLPGIVDPHVHLALDLGTFVSCDDFESGSRAAARGGITTLVDFLDPIAHEDALESALEARMKQAEPCHIDYAFHVTLAEFGGNIHKLVEMTRNFGMNSIKVFTTYSESGRMIQKHHLESLLREEIVTLVHAEDDARVDSNWCEVATYGLSRPVASEIGAIENLLEAMDAASPGKLYVVHVSSGSGVAKLKGHRNVTIESCPQYFYFNDSVFEGPNGRLFLLAPPFRPENEREKLNALIDSIDTIGTDHCPFKKNEKFSSDCARDIPKGVGGLPYSFLLMYNRFGDKIIDKMTQNVAERFGLKHKGKIDLGYDADLFLFDPNGITLAGSSSKDKPCDYTIYEGITLKGEIKATMVRGRFVMIDGEVMPERGKLIRCDE